MWLKEYYVYKQEFILNNELIRTEIKFKKGDKHTPYYTHIFELDHKTGQLSFYFSNKNGFMSSYNMAEFLIEMERFNVLYKQLEEDFSNIDKYIDLSGRI